ncbi:MAG: hypothetical protein HYZ28_22430 [Myxococcales bacterium]|nr:hypothetical protein [Myxococcales bacterium]
MAGRVGALAAALLGSGSFAAESIPVHLGYTAPDGCPDQSAFEEQLRERSPRVRRAVAGEPAQALVVSIAAEAETFHGTLSIRDSDGAETSRAIAGDHCDEVVSALALVAAVALEGRLEPLPEAVLDAAPPEEPSTAKARLPAPPPIDERGWAFAAEAGLFAQSGASPGVGLGASLGASARRLGEGSWRPEVRAGVAYLPEARTAIAGAAARFSMLAGRVEGCQVAVVTPLLLAEPCARIEVGALSATGLDLPDPRSATRPWASAGLLVRVELPLARAVSASLEGGVAFTLFRDRFAFGPDTTVHQVPAMTGMGAAGMRMRFW